MEQGCCACPAAFFSEPETSATPNPTCRTCVPRKPFHTSRFPCEEFFKKAGVGGERGFLHQRSWRLILSRVPPLLTETARFFYLEDASTGQVSYQQHPRHAKCRAGESHRLVLVGARLYFALKVFRCTDATSLRPGMAQTPTLLACFPSKSTLLVDGLEHKFLTSDVAQYGGVSSPRCLWCLWSWVASQAGHDTGHDPDMMPG